METSQCRWDGFLKSLLAVALKELVNEFVTSRTGGAGHCGEAWRRDAPERSPYNDRARWILHPSSGAKNFYYQQCFLLIQQLSYLDLWMPVHCSSPLKIPHPWLLTDYYCFYYFDKSHSCGILFHSKEFLNAVFDLDVDVHLNFILIWGNTTSWPWLFGQCQPLVSPRSGGQVHQGDICELSDKYSGWCLWSE